MPQAFPLLAFSCYLFLAFYIEYADPFPVSLIISPCSVRVFDLPREDEAQHIHGNTNTEARPLVPVIRMPSYSSPVKKKSEGVSVPVFRLIPSSVHHKKRTSVSVPKKRPVVSVPVSKKRSVVPAPVPKEKSFVPAPGKENPVSVQVSYKTNNHNRFFPWNDGVGESLWFSPYA